MQNSTDRPGLQCPEGSVSASSLQKEPGGQGEQSLWDVLPPDGLKLPGGHEEGIDEPSMQ